MPGTGLRDVPVNGAVYCFHAETGKTRWSSMVPNQRLVLNHFCELPFLLFAAHQQEWRLTGGALKRFVGVRSFAKSDGKVLYDSDRIPDEMIFHALNIDGRGGKVELIGSQLKLVFQLNGDAGDR